MARMIEAVLARKYPQIVVTRTVTLRDYEQCASIAEDFVISTARVSEKISRWSPLRRSPASTNWSRSANWCWWTERARGCWKSILMRSISALSTERWISKRCLPPCDQLRDEGFVDAEFLDSVIEREAIVSTLLGEGIALPHALGLLAKKPWSIPYSHRRGSAGGDDTAYVIFYWRSAKASTKRRWRSTIFSSLSCANALPP